jgi:glycosyltransferase involved in cell wall biosynthesis
MDREAFASRLDELLKDKTKAREMGERGLELVSERYDFEQYIKDLESMFARVIQESK